MSGHRQKNESVPNILNTAIIALLFAFGNSHFLTVNLRVCLKLTVNFVHTKPGKCGAKSCECVIFVHREARYCERSEQQRVVRTGVYFLFHM